ncbi:hypothetical protein GCM10028800_21250 [Nesterenkonia populi]
MNALFGIVVMGYVAVAVFGVDILLHDDPVIGIRFFGTLLVLVTIGMLWLVVLTRDARTKG